MSQSRVDTLRMAYEAFNEGDLHRVIDLAADDIEVCPPPTSLEPEPFRGRDALRRYLEPNLFELQQADPRELLEEGDRILVTAHVRARGRGSGVDLDEDVFHLWTIDGERAVRFEIFIDRDQALAALRR